MTLALVVALLAGLSTVVGGWLGTHRRLQRRDALAAALAFAAGLMITISVVQIAPSALASLDGVTGRRAAMTWVGLVLVAGVLAVVAIDRLLPHDVNPVVQEGAEPRSRLDLEVAAQRRHGTSSGVVADRALLRSGLILATVVGLHNLPEGLATFLATLEDPTIGITLAVAIAIHNIPEGIAVAAPIYVATGSRRRALFWATLSGLAEPFGAVVGYAVLRAVLPEEWLSLSLALVAGMMLAVSFLELLPAARRYQTHYTQPLVGFFLGAVVMVLSVQLLRL